MALVIFISTIFGLSVGASCCYLWREQHLKQQLQQVLALMETSKAREDISLPILSQLRRRAIISQQQQQQLEQQLFSWQSLLQEAPIGYLQVDRDNQVLWCNQMAQQLLQIQKWRSEQARLLLELVRSYELDRLVEKTRSTQVANELIWQFHAGYHDAANSQSIWLKANTIPLADGAIVIFIESQQDRVDAAAAQERWLGDLVHEIRTPLTVIHLLAETLQSKVSPDLTRWADKILHETNRSIDLVQDFLELSQLETSSTQYLQLAEVDFVRLINDVWHTLEPIASQKQIQLIYTGLPQLIVEIDPAKFTQVLINLFDNSIKYCPTQGHIWIDIHLHSSDDLTRDSRSPQPSRLELNLYDDGAGFDLPDLPHVFERLYRGDLSRYRPPQSTPNLNSQPAGTGLGLAIVHQIILAHKGTISANNHPSTGGAWLQLALPDAYSAASSSEY